MNTNQKYVVILWAVAILILVIFHPIRHTYLGRDSNRHMGYGCVHYVDIPKTVLWGFGISGVAFALWSVLRSGRKGEEF